MSTDHLIAKIFKTAVPSDNGTIHTIDTIEHEGKLWLVPQWLDKPKEGLSRPARIIRIDSLPHETSSGVHQFVLANYMPKAVLDGEIPPELESQYEVVELPEIVIRTGGGFH
jgi:hypothetical protein